jgi:hypothetical protein
VDAPLAVNVAELPIQTLVAVAAMLKLGIGFTEILIAALEVQPARVVPITVYEVVTVGDTTTLLPVKPPGFQV